MTAIPTRHMTLEEFLALPEGPPHYEFEEGELIPLPSPTLDHQDILLALAMALKQFVDARQLGRVFMEVDVYLPDGRVLIPDLGFLSAERFSLINPVDRKIHGTPDLVVEITSEDPTRDRIHKFSVYFNNGVPWYWIIDSATLAVEEYRATPEGYLRVSSVGPGAAFQPRLFPGFAVNLAERLEVAAPETEAEPPQD
ncbi:MAG TPA: Uma2 family endonuclease [Chthonomonadaceae bacterium]|nr:Uma2 family endonuclease [Chthonomonadaceae bacterium]